MMNSKSDHQLKTLKIRPNPLDLRHPRSMLRRKSQAGTPAARFSCQVLRLRRSRRTWSP